MVKKSEFARMAGVAPASVTGACKTVLKAACSGRGIDETHPDAVAYLRKHDKTQTDEPAPGIDPLYQDAVNCGKRTAHGIRTALKIGTKRAERLLALIVAAGNPPPSDNPKPRTVSGQEKIKQTKKSEALDSLNSGKTLHEIPADIQKFADMTLRELIQRFGTDSAFVDWLKAVKEIESINAKRLANAKTQGELVSRQLVKVGIIDPIDSAHIRLLSDGVKTICKRATAMHDAGRPLGDLEKFVADQISSFIRPVKAKVERSLRDA